MTLQYIKNKPLTIKQYGKDIKCVIKIEKVIIININGLDPLIRSVSRVTTARDNASSVFQLFSFLVVCSGMISKGFSFVAFFAGAEASSVCIHLTCLVCLYQSCASSGDSELGRVSSGWLTSPSLSNFGGS